MNEWNPKILYFYAFELQQYLLRTEFDETETFHVLRTLKGCGDTAFSALFATLLPETVFNKVSNHDKFQLARRLAPLSVEDMKGDSALLEFLLQCAEPQIHLKELNLITALQAKDIPKVHDILKTMEHEMPLPVCLSFITLAPVLTAIFLRVDHQLFKRIVELTAPVCFRYQDAGNRILESAITHDQVHAVRLVLDKKMEIDAGRYIGKAAVKQKRNIYLTLLMTLPTNNHSRLPKIKTDQGGTISLLHYAILHKDVLLYDDMFRLAAKDDLHELDGESGVPPYCTLLRFGDGKKLVEYCNHPEFEWREEHLPKLYSALNNLQSHSNYTKATFAALLRALLELEMPLLPDIPEYHLLQRLMLNSNNQKLVDLLFNHPDFILFLDVISLRSLNHYKFTAEIHPLERLVIQGKCLVMDDLHKSEMPLTGNTSLRVALQMLSVIYNLWQPDKKERAVWILTFLERVGKCLKHPPLLVSSFLALPPELKDMVVRDMVDLPKELLPPEMFDRWKHHFDGSSVALPIAIS